MARRNTVQSYVDRAQDRLPRPVGQVVRGLRREDVLLTAAGLAFYGLVSVAPFVILALWAVSLLTDQGEVRQVGSQLARLLPPKLGVDRAFATVAGAGAGLGVWAALGLLWPATAYGSGLTRAFDRLSRRDEPTKGLRGRARALALLGLGPVLVLVTLLAAYGATSLLGVHGRVAAWVLSLVFGFAVSLVTTGVIYRVFSPVSLSWSGVGKGACTAAAGIAVLSATFVVYLNVGSDFEHRYATSGLAAVVLLGLWLFCANALLLVGYQAALET